MDLMPLFKTSIEAMFEGFNSNVDYLENRHRNFIQKKYGKKTSAGLTRFIFWTVIFLYGLFTLLTTPKGKKD